ncbi:ribosomal oxygenase 1 isoform X2 [Diabrotica virgifera virgifera]|uniref:Bifunctional lysine-specific demethylase and histidyl-hydroxylase n=1 Tax=Diabrotica virgifera virgifera TaxID=50390 RepID=A0ABM5IP24_DIAVI|nr:ribosomal oxygenase 1 isoform X2 [Diabrotica virgifera virgifera]
MNTPISAFSVYRKKPNPKIVKRQIVVKKQVKKKMTISLKKCVNKIKQKNTNPNPQKLKDTVKPRAVITHNLNQNFKKVDNKIKKTTSPLSTKLKKGTVFHNKDPVSESLKLFKWLIAPLSPTKFFEQYWEVKALHIQHNSPHYFSDILTTARLDSIFREFPLYYTKNIDVVSYENGVKEVHNEQGKVVASALYDYYSNGCSIRLLNPQTYDQKVHLLVSTLQEYFGTLVGANTYLTPPNSQGFAPHYDDIEAFVIQLEGRKHWKLYKPRGSDVLARESSPNLKHHDIGEPFMSVTLNAGDILYFPRGTIHEGRTDPDCHSFHITVSVYQHNSFADLLEHALPEALKKASLDNIRFRAEIDMDTEVRLLRYFCLRLVTDEKCSKLYYNTENAKIYHGEEEQVLEIDSDLIPTIEMLQSTYPKFTNVQRLVENNNSNMATIQLVSDLWEHGLLITNNSLTTGTDD